MRLKQRSASASKTQILKTIKKNTKHKSHNMLTKKRGWFDIEYYKVKWHNRFNPSQLLLINMQMRTGKHSQFMINLKGESFVYKGGEYVIDTNAMYYVSSSSCYALDYHQDLSIPIKRNIPAKEIDRAIKESSILDIENATNPSTLRTFITSEVIKNVMQAQQIHDYLRAMKLMVIIILICVIITMLINLSTSGIIKAVMGAVGI